MDIMRVLSDYGLSEKEANVYLSCLKAGVSTANQIAVKSKILRTTAYEILRQLIEKGLVSTIIKNNIKYFEAAEPTELINILERKKQKLKKIMPILKQIKTRTATYPSVVMYEGKSGLKTILDKIIEERPSELLTLSSSKIFETLHYFFPNWIKHRVKNKIRAKILQEKVPIIRKYNVNDRHELREIRFLPDTFKINTAIHVYNNKTIILTLEKSNPVGVVIDDRHVAETFRSVFYFLFNRRG